MLILKNWMFQGTVSISSDFYLTFCLGKVKALCFSLTMLTLIWIILHTNKCCNKAICKSSLGTGNFISWEISKCQGPFSEIAQSFLKFLWDGKNRNCSVWGALAGSQQLDKDSDFEGELAYSKDHKWKRTRRLKHLWNTGISFPEDSYVYDCIFHHLFQEPNSFLELAQGFSAAWAGLSTAIPWAWYGTSEGAQRRQHAQKWCPEQGSVSLLAWETQSYKLLGAVQLGKQAKGTLLPEKTLSTPSVIHKGTAIRTLLLT